VRSDIPERAQPAVRLKKRAEFVAVAKGKRVNSSALTLQAIHRPPSESVDMDSGQIGLPPVKGPRFGLTVTNKTGNSPERNRMRRRLREILRLRPNSARDSFDYVIIARRAVLTLPFEQLSAEVARAIHRIHDARPAHKVPNGAKTTQHAGPADL